MTFDIHQLDGADDWGENEEALGAYKETLVNLFLQSPEGQAHVDAYPDSGGYWPGLLIEFSYYYIGETIPGMTVSQVDEIVTEIFPRKVSILDPDEALEVLPALIAFWEYLKREYTLKNADDILAYLRQMKPAKYKGIMNDSSRFGMAKSFFAMGQEAGFDMTNEDEINKFMLAYNAAILPPDINADDWPGIPGAPQTPTPIPAKRANDKRKKKRKAAKAARKKNRRRR